MAIQVTVMSIDFDSFEEPVTKVFNKNEITVGRKEGNDLVLNRPEVSSYHAKLFIRPNGKKSAPKLFITDLGSSNGTMLERENLKPDTEVRVQPNQRLIIGSYLLKPVIIGGMVDESELQQAEVARVIDNDADNYVSKPTEFRELPKDLVREIRARDQQEKSEPEISAPQADDPTLVQATHEFELPANALEDLGEGDMASGSDNEVTRTQISNAMPPVVTLNIDEESVLDLHFEATALYRLGGRVTHGGKGLAGVRVDGGDLGTHETDAEGRFSAAAEVSDGTPYRLLLSKPGYLLEPSLLSGNVSGDTDLQISAAKLHQLSIRIMHHGLPLSGVRVDAGTVGSGTTDADGLLTFRDIREGTSYKVHVGRERFIFDVADAQGSVDRDVTLNFTARKLITVAGRVLHKGKPLAGVEIECVKLGKTTTDSQGRYTFEDVPEGAEYTFTAQKPGFRFSHTRQA